MNENADRASRRGEDVGGVIVFGPRTAPDALGGTAGGTPAGASEELVEVVDQCGSPQDLCDAEGACFTMKELGMRDACAQPPRVHEDCGGGPAEGDGATALFVAPPLPPSLPFVVVAPTPCCCCCFPP